MTYATCYPKSLSLYPMYESPIFIPKDKVFFYNILTGGIDGVFFYIIELKALGLVSDPAYIIFALTFTKACGLTLTFVSLFKIGSII